MAIWPSEGVHYDPDSRRYGWQMALRESMQICGVAEQQQTGVDLWAAESLGANGEMHVPM